jgi:2-polyprenyl-3-methyl-5-hydroxy-6-metoxy-1,4-benzoquinol methylase
MNDLPGIESLQASMGIGVIPRPFCLLCSEEGKHLYMAMVDWLFGVPGNWGLRRCRSCDVAWLDPQPVAKDIGKLYARYYTHSINAPLTRLGRLRHATLQCVLARLGYPVHRPKEILPQLLSHVRSVARAAELDVLALPPSETGVLLDVGCGNGEFIARMRSFGWTVFGVDPDATAVSYARSRGLEVFRGMISDLPDTPCYDVINLNHVIEHAIDPVGLLRECRKRLRLSNGRLIITTPNINSLGHWWFNRYWRGLEVPRHLILFSPDGLRECVKRAGLSLYSLCTETRLARMIYGPSVCAKHNGRDVGERTSFKVSTKVAAYMFQGLEDLLLYVKKDLGEEIHCVCAAGTEV